MLFQDDKLNRVYNIYIDYLKLSNKYQNTKMMYLRKEGIEKNRNWKIFSKLDDLSLQGKIKLPDFFESQFKSPLWGKHQIYPNMLISERAFTVWNEYKEKKSNKGEYKEDCSFIDVFFNKIKLELSLTTFLEKYTNDDGQFDAELYINIKITLRDVVYKVLISTEKNILKEAIQKEKKEEKEIVKSKIEEIANSEIPEIEKEMYKSDKKRYLKAYYRVLNYILVNILEEE